MGIERVEVRRSLSDLLLLEMRSAGVSVADLAAASGIAAASVRQRLAELDAEGARGSSAPLLAQDPLNVVEGVLRRTLFTWQLLARVAASAETDSARVSALRGMLDADARSVALLQSLGRLPRELGTLRRVVDTRALARDLLEAVSRLEAGEASPRDVRNVLLRYAGESTAEEPVDATVVDAGDPPPGDPLPGPSAAPPAA